MPTPTSSSPAPSVPSSSCRVFVPQERSEFDLTPALEYGELVVLNHGGDVYHDATGMIREMRQKLQDITPEAFIMMIGDPIAIGAAVATAASILGGNVKCLKWSRRNRRYLVIDMRLW